MQTSSIHQVNVSVYNCTAIQYIYIYNVDKLPQRLKLIGFKIDVCCGIWNRRSTCNVSDWHTNNKRRWTDGISLPYQSTGGLRNASAKWQSTMQQEGPSARNTTQPRRFPYQSEVMEQTHWLWYRIQTRCMQLQITMPPSPSTSSVPVVPIPYYNHHRQLLRPREYISMHNSFLFWMQPTSDPVCVYRSWTMPIKYTIQINILIVFCCLLNGWWKWYILFYSHTILFDLVLRFVCRFRCGNQSKKQVQSLCMWQAGNGGAQQKKNSRERKKN